MRTLVTLAVVVLTALTAHGQAISIDEYAGSLERTSVLLRENHLTMAQNEAARLTGRLVLSPNGTFHTDDALLHEVANAKRVSASLQIRLAATAAELRRVSATRVDTADQRLLQELIRAQTVQTEAAGGEALPSALTDAPLMERVGEVLTRAIEWIGEKLTEFFEWLAGFWPKSSLGKSEATTGMRWLVLTIVALIAVALGVLAFEVIRRSRRAGPAPVIESDPISSRKDEDPRSRGANEWERYAAQLAAAGRIREAIRAWYHAVLVTLYSQGILHYRKGRTNWEYVSLLAPSLPWRSDFIQLTRRFEQEWYGSDSSSTGALEECARRAGDILDALRGARSAA